MNSTLLRKLQQHDQYICQIIHTSPDTSLYTFDGGTNKWDKLNIDGTFYLCKRTLVPFYCFLISSAATGKSTLKENLTKDMMIQIQIPFLLYKRSGEVKGILFKEEGECVRVGKSINNLLSEMNDASPREGNSNSVKSVTPSSENPSTGIALQTHVSNPIPQAQVSATSSGPNSIIRMLHSAAAKHSPPTSNSSKPDTNRMRPQSIATPQQHMVSVVNSTTSNVTTPSQLNAGNVNKNPSHWSSKTHTISVDYLFKSLRASGQRSPPRTSSPKQTPLTPTQPVVPVPGSSRGGANCLTLSEVEQQAMVEASECLRQQLGIGSSDNGVVNSMSGRGDGRPLAQSTVPQKSSNDHPNNGSRSLPSAVVAVDDDDDDDEGLVLTPSMMEQAVISSPDTIPLVPGPVAESNKDSSKTAVKDYDHSVKEIEAVALTKTQLKQALLSLIQDDDDFVSRIHHAYIQNLQRHLK